MRNLMNSPGKNHPILTKYKINCGIQLIMYLNKPETDQIAQKIKKKRPPQAEVQTRWAEEGGRAGSYWPRHHLSAGHNTHTAPIH